MKLAERILSKIKPETKEIVEGKPMTTSDLEDWTKKQLKKLKLSELGSGDLVEMVRFASNDPSGLRDLISLMEEISNFMDEDEFEFDESISEAAKVKFYLNGDGMTNVKPDDADSKSSGKDKWSFELDKKAFQSFLVNKGVILKGKDLLDNEDGFKYGMLESVDEGLSGSEVEALLKKANSATILDMLADAVESDNKKLSDFLSKSSEKAAKLEK